MYCKYCGKELPEDAKFCPSCGKSIDAKNESVVYETTPAYTLPKEPKVWITFAKIGKVLGVISIAICWIPMLTLSTVGIPGIVFSALGKKSKLYNNEAHTGFTLSLLGTIISGVVYFLIFIIAACSQM